MAEVILRQITIRNGVIRYFGKQTELRIKILRTLLDLLLMSKTLNIFSTNKFLKNILGVRVGQLSPPITNHIKN